MKYKGLLSALIMLVGGGGFANLNAVELSTICTGGTTQECKIDNNYKDKDITNKNSVATKKINIETQVKSFTNNGTISGELFISPQDNNIQTIINYGTMDGIQSESTSENTLILNNQGIINIIPSTTSTHISTAKTKILIQNYKIKIDESANEFNNFKGGDSVSSEASKNSHLMISIVGGKIEFKDINSKIILAFGEKFSFGKAYFISKLVTGTSGEKDTNLNVDFSRLEIGDKDLYTLIKSGDDSFIVNLIGGGGGSGSGGGNSIILHTPITELYKSNVRTMNNFTTMSNSMIYPRKHHKSQNLRKSSLRASEANVAIQDLNTNDTFFYQNESQNPQTRRIQRHNKRNYSRSRNPRNNNLVILSDSEESKKKNRGYSITSLTQNDKYYFILTPFVNYNNFAKSGNYNLSGFDYGFLTAFSGKVAESNSLGTHFAFGYGSLNDSHDKDLSITSMNFMLGVNYKLDLVYDMFFKARGDFFYFSNALDSATIKNIKPNNLGFGVSVSYGKDFDFKRGGVLGIEAGLDYKALQTNNIELHDNTYQKSLYHLLYVDLGISYAKYFGGFGFNANLGIKGNITANKLAKSQIRLKNFNRSVDMVLDNDKVLGYANVALSYVLNHKNFDMEFSLAYYGNYGDRVISNGGGFEWRVGF